MKPDLFRAAMKAESLYHLLQIRARKLEESADPEVARRIRDVQEHLQVTYTRGWFEVRWRSGQVERNLSVADAEFIFHLAGDTQAVVAKRGEVSGLREQNWLHAGKLWREIARLSGFHIPEELLDDALGLAPRATAVSGVQTQWIAGGIAVLACLIIGALQQGAGGAFALAIFSLLLIALSVTLDSTHLQRRLSPAEIALVGVGAIPAVLAAADILWLLPLTAGLASAAWLERSGRRDARLWFMSGVLLSGPCAFLGWLGVFPGLAFAGALLFPALILPARLQVRLPVALLSGAVIGLGLSFVPAFPPVASSPFLDAPWLEMSIAVVLTLAAGFVTWWIAGSMFRLAPWLALGALSIAVMIPITSGDPARGPSAMALAGLAILLWVRLGRALFQNRMGFGVIKRV